MFAKRAFFQSHGLYQCRPIFLVGAPHISPTSPPSATPIPFSSPISRFSSCFLPCAPWPICCCFLLLPYLPLCCLYPPHSATCHIQSLPVPHTQTIGWPAWSETAILVISITFNKYPGDWFWDQLPFHQLFHLTETNSGKHCSYTTIQGFKQMPPIKVSSAICLPENEWYGIF